MAKTHLMFLMRDPLPPTRPDVAVLFGKELPKCGITSDLLGQAESSSSPDGVSWAAGALWCAGAEAKGIRGELMRTWNDLFGLVFHLGSEHDLIQVRDKIRTALMALVIARLYRKPFVYWMSFPIAEGHASRARQVGKSQGIVVWLANRMRAAVGLACFYKIVCRSADHLFVQSDAMIEYMEERGVSRERMTAVPMGVDVSTFRAVERLADVHGDAACVGRCGS